MDVTLRGFSGGQRVFNRYRLDRVLGRGGMGVVWLATDEALERQVALKFLPELVCLDKEAIADLKRETRRSLEITHPNIVRIYDFEQDETTAAIAMEYVDGTTLAGLKVERKGCVGVSELRPLLGQLCEALDYAHLRAKVVHRDLKPANLMVTRDGELKVTDFGISCSISDSVSRVSVARGSSGTAVFMSPQQAMGQRPTAADDIYALGATIYDLLSGKPPFYRGDVLAQLREAEAGPMAARREELGLKGEPVPDVWEAVVSACLSKDADRRPKTAGEVFERLEARGAGRPGAAVPEKPRGISQAGQGGAEERSFIGHRPSAMALAGIAGGLALAVGAAWMVWSKRGVEQGERAAEIANRSAGSGLAPSAEPAIPPPSGGGPGGTASVAPPETTKPKGEVPAVPEAKPAPIAPAMSLEDRARAGDALAQYELGVACRDGAGRPKDAAKAAEWFRQAADQGHAGAQNALGDAYRKGEGLGRDYAEALKWIRKAAEQGFAGGQANLGFLYSRGFGVGRDPGEAVKWYRMAAQQGDPDGLNRLGYCYSSGRGVERDLTRAADLYAAAMAKGSFKAQVNLANMYREGRGVPKDEAKALALCRDAAEKGYDGAWNALGIAYQNGSGVEADLAQAISWFRKAAEAGDAAAQCNIGLLYEGGKGVAQDFAVAADWYRRAAEQGDARGQSYLGTMYRYGHGVTMDPARAAELFRSAADQGDLTSMRVLGSMYEFGVGVTKDAAMAFQWYRQAAEGGDEDGQCNVGVMYEYGRGVKQDHAEAAAWYRRAADTGWARGLCFLATMYENGRGVGKDLAKAVELYRAAAEKDYAMAHNNLGVMYANGLGVRKDAAKAAACYEQAARKDHLDALRNLAAAYDAGSGVERDPRKAAELRRRADAVEHGGGASQAPAPEAKPERIFENGNLAAVGRGPTSPTMFRIKTGYVITRILTYHWNDGRGAAPGTISLKSEDGRVYGPWQATGALGQGGVPNAYWVATPNVVLPPGTYRVLDSDTRTWAQNRDSGGRGIVEVEGVPQRP